MSRQEAERRIAGCRETQNPILDLSNLGLTDVPPATFALSHLRTLILGNTKPRFANRIQHLPNEIGLLNNLVKLDLSGNRLRELPQNINQLTKLSLLSLRSNEFSILPHVISQLTELETLHVGSNGLTSLPESIGQLSKLTELALNSNELYTLPHSIGELSLLKRLTLHSNKLGNYPDVISHLTNLIELYLGSNQLQLIPHSIEQLVNLSELYLHDNWLNTLPNSMAQLTRIRVLILAKNQFEKLPDVITQLISLYKLDLRMNHLLALPKSISNLANLEELDLGSNELSNLPDTLTELNSLFKLKLNSNSFKALPDIITSLTNLKELELSYNEIGILPEKIECLVLLQKLDLDGNRINTIPQSIKRLTNLQILNLNSNHLSRIPLAVAQIPNLKALYLVDNELSTLPETLAQLVNLQSLHLDSNRLSQLPDAITELIQLKILSLVGNPLTDPPLEIATQGIDAIRTYFAERAATPEDIGLYESKLLLVGEGRVGKTSLSKSLRIPDYELEDEQSTEGIDIQTWTIPAAETGLDEDFRLNVWDFGGQEIYHATHQFFLTRRSLYLLVTESRREDKHDDFYYWFNIIRLLGDNAPVVVVLNKCDQPTKELPIEEYRKAFDNIIHYEKVSCAQGWGETIANLKANIRRILTDKALMPHVGDRLPGVWVRIRRDLAELRDQGLDYIPYQQFLGLCAQHNMVEPARINLVGGYFHDLGIFLHFRDDWDLVDTVFLNHEWVTDGVYRVLDNATVKAQQGRFTDADLQTIWADAGYRDKQRELLALMKNTKFELCYELPEVNRQRQGYLAPQLLPVDEIAYEWRTAENNLRFEYRYDFMPKGMLSRFIVKRHRDIVQATDDVGNPLQVHWRYGVLLAWEGTRALVRERYFEKKITIALEGENKIGFLAIIRRSIEEIHADFHNLAVHEMVPCNCDECRAAHRPHFFRHELLQRYLRKGVYTIRCDESLAEVKVRMLLREAILPELDEREDRERYIVYGDLIRGDKVGGDKAGGDIIDVGDIRDADDITIGKEIGARGV